MSNRAAFYYDPNDLVIVTNVGNLERECIHCHALCFMEERSGLCCNNGSVSIPEFDNTIVPELMNQLLTGNHSHSRHYLQNTRQYNGLFNFTSFRANEQFMTNTNGNRAWTPGFKVLGQVYHQIGPMFPAPNEPEGFLQIYFLNEQEQQRRRSSIYDGLNNNLIHQLTRIMENNPFAQQFVAAASTIRSSTIPNLRIVIKENSPLPSTHHRGQYNRPSRNNIEIAVLMPDEPTGHRDIIVTQRDQGLKRINELHPAYDGLQYPLIFTNGGQGYSCSSRETNMKHYAYKIMVRKAEPSNCATFSTPNGMVSTDYQLNPILASRSLYYQFIVDMCAKIITERLLWFRLHQSEIRAECYGTLIDHLQRDRAADSTGQAVRLPATFFGSPRYMFEKQMDSMAILRRYGKASIFVTMTTNPQWSEIVSNIYPNQSSVDRPDIVSRVFSLKQKVLIDLITKKNIFGECVADVWNLEYQKRLLQHTHNLFWLKENMLNPATIDNLVWAEIPCPVQYPNLHKLVLQFMVHGPCGHHNPSSPCMINGSCCKHYPKQYQSSTTLNDQNYAVYKRRSPDMGGLTAEKRVKQNGIDTVIMIDNSWIVPYSPFLLEQFECHINVEIVRAAKAFKYCLKYVNKGSDRTVSGLQNEVTDEISDFENKRYIGCNEAATTILGLKRNGINPTIVMLTLHLQNQQWITFDPNTTTAESAEDGRGKSQLEAFFELCLSDSFAQSLYYHEVPEFYIWVKSSKSWKRRVRGGNKVFLEDGTYVVHSKSIGRLYSVSPRVGELYYLRLLLVSIRGPTSFDYLKSVNGNMLPTFKEACNAQGLLDNDDHLIRAMEELSQTSAPHKLRDFFVTIACCTQPTNLLEIWNTHVDDMCEDILYRERSSRGDFTLQVSDIMRESLLIELNKQILDGGGPSLSTFGFTIPSDNSFNVRTAEYIINRWGLIKSLFA